MSLTINTMYSPASLGLACCTRDSPTSSVSECGGRGEGGGEREGGSEGGTVINCRGCKQSIASYMHDFS